MPFRLTIARRLWLWAAFATLIFYVAAALGWFGLAAARDSLQRVHDDNLGPVMKMTRFRDVLSANRVELLLALQHDPAGQLVGIHDHPTQAHFDRISQNATELDRLFDEFRAIFTDAHEQQLFKVFETHRDAWIAKVREVVASMKAGDFSPGVAAAALAAGRVEFKAAIDALQALADHKVAEAEQEYRNAAARYETTRAILLTLIVLGAVIGTLTGMLSMRRLNTGLAQANEAARSIAAGDLSHQMQVTGQDEITEVLLQMSTMRDNLVEIVSAIGQETQHLNEQSAELNRSARASSTVADRQSEAASSMAAAVEQLSVSIDQVEEGIRLAYEAGTSVTRIRGASGEVTEAVDSIGLSLKEQASAARDIAARVEHVSQGTEELAASAQQTATAAAELAQIAMTMGQLASRFRLA